MSPKKNEVILHIYDLPEINNYIQMFTQNLGVFHTGTEILKQEYSFGGHPYDYSGIYITKPKDISSLSVDKTFKYKESKVIGYSELTEEEIRKIVKEFGSNDFKGIHYNLIQRNCNHFSDVFCKKLCGKGIPDWVNKMVEIIGQFPIIEQQIPKEYITPTALAKSVKEQEKNKKQNQPKPKSPTSGSDKKP